MTTHGERITALETEMKSIKELAAGLVKDVRHLQNRWAFIMGGIMILSRLPDIIHFIGSKQ